MSMNGTFIIIAVLIVTGAIVVALISVNIKATQTMDDELKALSKDPCVL